MASDANLATVYVDDENTLDTMKKTFSPESDRLDKSIAWEDFKRDEMYRILKHVDDARSYGYTRYVNAYVQEDSPISKADFPYLHHVQTETRDIENASDGDQAGWRMATTRQSRRDFQAFPSFEEWAADNLPPDLYEANSEEIEMMGIKIREAGAEQKRLDKLRIPPTLEAKAYKEKIYDPADPRLDDLYPGQDVPYSYEDWQHELRRNVLLRSMDDGILPPMAEKALDQRREKENKPHLLSLAQRLAKYTNLGEYTKPLKEFHQRNLRLYGSHYEIGEPFKAPGGPLESTLAAALDASVAAAVEWREPNSSLMLGASTSKAESFDEAGADRDAEADRSLIEDMELDQIKEDADAAREAPQETQLKLEAQRLAREKRRTDAITRKQNTADLKKYHKLLDRIELFETRDTDPSNQVDADNLVEQALKGEEERNNDDEISLFHTDENEEYDTDGNPLTAHKKMVRTPAEGFKYLQFETVGESLLPDHDLSTLDPSYQHTDSYEKLMLRALDPEMKDIEKLTSDPELLVTPRVFHIHNDVKQAMYRLNRANSAKWHSRELATMFGLSLIRTQAILKLQWLEEKYVEEHGYNLAGEANDADMMQTHDVQLAQWDPNVFNNITREGGVAFVDEGELEILRKLEKQRNDRYWEREYRLIAEERAMYATGQLAYGAPAPNLPPPMPISAKKHRKARHETVLTAIDDQKKGNFRVATRDRHGVLREPNEEEFKRVRRRERSPKAFFNHVPYQANQKI